MSMWCDGQCGQRTGLAPTQGLSPRLEEGRFSMEWPMWLIRGDILASLPGITTHEDLVRQGKLCQWQPDHPRRVALISHQWVSVNHPDPQGKQLSVLQEALRNMASGKASMIVDAFTAGGVGHRPGIELAMPSAEEQRACLQWDYWYDYFSIPQLDVQSLHLAVKSIPAYCSVVDFTIVLAPCLQHEDTGEVLGVLSWQRRGWCRLERSASLLASRACLIMVTSPQKFVVKSGPEWVLGWPVEGDFSLETDRHMVGEVTSFLLSIYRTGLLKKGDLQAWRFYTALMSKAKLYPDFPPNENLSHFLQRYNMSASDSSQLSPLMLASLEGNLSVMQALLREGCDVDAVTKFEIPEAHVNGTNTALSLAALLSTPEAVQLLLEARASVNVPKAQGGVPLLTQASYFGNAAVLPLLIRARADVHASCFVVAGALSLSATSSNPECTRILLEHRADPNLEGTLGGKPLCMAALMQADARHTQLLLEARADPNAFNRSSLVGALTLPLRVKYRLGLQDPVSMPFLAGLGGTALHVAATTGCFEQAKLLLQFRAFHSCRHEMLTDLTPIQLAKDVQDETMTALLLLAAAGRDLEDSDIDDMDSLCI